MRRARRARNQSVPDAFQLPFEDDSFDVVIVESVLTPLPGDKKQALAEMVRVVRPGGQDDGITKRSKQYMGYALITGVKNGARETKDVEPRDLLF